MAKGRKPQFSFDDLRQAAMAMFGGATTPTTNPNQAMGQAINSSAVKYFDPRDFGKSNNLLTDIYDYGNPLPMITAEETRRLINQGGRPDQGHLASLALLGALLKGGPAVVRAYRGAKTAYRGNKKMFKDAKAPAGARTQPKRAATTNMLGTINDPMAQYAALLAATNRR